MHMDNALSKWREEPDDEMRIRDYYFSGQRQLQVGIMLMTQFTTFKLQLGLGGGGGGCSGGWWGTLTATTMSDNC